MDWQRLQADAEVLNDRNRVANLLEDSLGRTVNRRVFQRLRVQRCG